jgi:hypothetical protein
MGKEVPPRDGSGTILERPLQREPFGPLANAILKSETGKFQPKSRGSTVSKAYCRSPLLILKRRTSLSG